MAGIVVRFRAMICSITHREEAREVFRGVTVDEVVVVEFEALISSAVDWLVGVQGRPGVGASISCAAVEGLYMMLLLVLLVHALI
jgi:hypothetical protein